VQIDLFPPVPPKLGQGDGARFSQPDRHHRYALWRTWSHHGPRVVFVMLNPSVANEKEPDLTLTKCCEFARRWGYGGVVLVNLFTWVETQSEELVRRVHAGEPVNGPGADAAIVEALALADRIVIATGDVPFARERLAHVLALCAQRPVQCLGLTKAGFPRHPSRLGYAATLMPFDGLPAEPFDARGLTFWRPWAEAIFRPVPPGATAPHPKDVDNRPRPPGFMRGKRIAVHTAQRIHHEGLDWLRRTFGYPWTVADLAHPGVILGTVRVAGTVTEGARAWFFGPEWNGKENVGWLLDDVRPFATPIPFTPSFARGFWRLPPDVLARVEMQYHQHGERA